MADKTRSVSSVFLREAERLSAVSKGTATAVARAKQDLARRLPVQARRDIQTEYNLPANRITSALRTVNNANGVTLIAASRGIGLIAFSGRDGGKRSEGASAKVFTQEASHTYAGTFVAIGLSGNRQIFERHGPARRMEEGNYVGRLKQPLRVLYGPSAAGMLRKGDREQRLGDFAQSILAEKLAPLILTFEQS